MGRRSSRQAKNRIIDQVLTISGTSDDSRSTGDDYLNGEIQSNVAEDGGSWTGLCHATISFSMRWTSSFSPFV